MDIRVGRRLWMMAAVLVLAGSVIVATERADAQSTTILVSNQGTNPDSHGFLFGPDPTYNTNYELAGAFTTGPNDHGYGLASVTLELAPNTTYWLVAYATDAVLTVAYTEILDEDAGKKPGWSIGDAVFMGCRVMNTASSV